MITCPREPNPGERISASWMRDLVRYVRAITPRPGPGMRTTETPDGTFLTPGPTKVKGTKDALKPFTVRYVSTDSTSPHYVSNVPYTGFEIYLPLGCAIVGSSARPINLEAAREIDGSLQEISGWYRLKDPVSPASNSDFDVVVHVKPSAAETGVDTFTDFPKTLLLAEAHNQTRSQSDADADPCGCGDAFSMLVARIHYVSGEITIEQYVDTPVSMTYSPTEEFELLWCFQVDQSSGQTVTLTNIYLRNASFSAAGVTFAADSMTAVPVATEAVYLRLDTSTSPYTATIISYATETHSGTTLTVAQQVTNETTAHPYVIMVRLYSLTSGHVKVDGRTSAHNIQVYKA